LQINDELEVHTGLLEELDHDLDNTGNRLSRTGRQLGRVAKGAKEHGERRRYEILVLHGQLMKKQDQDLRLRC